MSRAMLAPLVICSAVLQFALPAASIGIPHFPVNHNPKHSSGVGYKFVVKYKEQLLDHFNFIGDPLTFQQRYLVNDEHWKPGGPIFFYTGNEGDIIWFSNNTGFVWDIAPEFGAMVVFAEHRYYGTTLPFGKDSYKDPQHLGYLTAEQALADFAVLIRYMKDTVPGAKNSPVVAFGGSYGGMLASWFRMKYPSAIVGAIAASAPVLAYPTVSESCDGSYRVITKDFLRHGSQECVANVKNSWPTVDKFISSVVGLQSLSSVFKLCKPLRNYNDGVALKEWLQGLYFNMAMVEYPYPASFLEPLPAWPIKKFCANLADGSLSDVHLLKQLSMAVGVYLNYTGEAECFNMHTEAVKSLDDKGWGFQACTEQVMPMCTNGKTDMFPPSEWNYEAFAKSCKQQWGVTTREYWAATVFNGRTLGETSNIVFSNGDLDPWSAFGVLKSDNPSIVTVMIEDGAHHLDLRSSNPADPKSVIDARNIHKENIRKWIQLE